MKAAIGQIQEEYAFSERRACAVMLLAVGTYRYVSQRSDEPLRTRLVKLAREKPRFGYRRAAPQVMRAPLSIYPSDENISFSLSIAASGAAVRRAAVSTLRFCTTSLRPWYRR